MRRFLLNSRVMMMTQTIHYYLTKIRFFFITLSTVRLIRGLILDRLQVRNVVEVLDEEKLNKI